MVKRLCLVVSLVVLCFAGCGKGKTLKELSYSELTALREIEVKHLYEEKNGTDEYYDVVQRLIVINTLRNKAWETEGKATGVKVETIEELRTSDKAREDAIRKSLGLPPSTTP